MKALRLSNYVAMISLNEFAEQSDLTSQSELERFRRLVFFLCKSNSASEISITSVVESLDVLHLPRPNMSRLKARLTAANGFVKPASIGLVKLHLKKMREYAELFPILVDTPRGKFRTVADDGLYVSGSRLAELERIASIEFDLRKLLALLRELNTCAATDCHLAVAMIVRAIIDHVPPIFGCNTFNEVVNNASGTKSFKESMRHLNDGARKIADAHLHVPIRARETLPNERQVDFSQSLDVLLSEIVRKLPPHDAANPRKAG